MKLCMECVTPTNNEVLCGACLREENGFFVGVPGLPNRFPPVRSAQRRAANAGVKNAEKAGS